MQKLKSFTNFFRGRYGAKKVIGFLLLLLLQPTTYNLQPLRALALVQRAIKGDIVARVSPDDPSPYSTVKIAIVSYEENLELSIVTWNINGKTVLQGVGKTELTFQAGGLGEVQKVNIHVASPDGGELEKEITINPGDIDLLWQADSYVPPSYRGKPILTSGSQVRFTALATLVDPQGRKIPPSQLIYEWQRNDEKISGAAGYGKEQLVASGFSILKDDVIGVLVRDPVSGAGAKGSVALRAATPRLLFYVESLLGGTQYEKAYATAYAPSGNESTLRAEPYFLSTTQGSHPSFDWKFAGNPAEADQENSALITLRQERQGAGEGNLACTATSENGASVNGLMKIVFGHGVITF